PHGERELEIVVLRHQLAILRRGGKRTQYTTADRALLAAASRLLPPERWSCFAVGAQTLRRWHRTLLQGGRGHRRRTGRPPLADDTRSLIKRSARENPRWAGATGASRARCGSSGSAFLPPRSRTSCAPRDSARRRGGSVSAGRSFCAPRRSAC